MSAAKYTIIAALFVLLLQESVAPPTTKNKDQDKSKEEKEGAEQERGPYDEIDVEYKRYLEEVVKTLETDPEFRKKLETAEEIDFRNGKVANELEYVHHNVRTKLDEIKRTELNRLRELVKKAQEASHPNEIHPSVYEPPEHLDHSNPHSFEVADLHKLINKVTRDLTEADMKRRDEFKEYELQKQFEKQQVMKTMDEKQKEDYLKSMEEQKKKHNQHEPLHHPGSKAQLEEVWEKQDHMENQEFNPKTFFYLHDLDGNGYWDETEVKALFKKELDKMYQAGAPEDDMKERQEEMERMREHVFKETDTNKDKLISFDEFLTQTKKQEFYQDEGWDPIDPQQVYSQKEYEEFEARRQKEIQKLIDQGVLPQQPHNMGYQPHYQQHHMPQYQQYHMPGGQGMGHGVPQNYAPQHPHNGQPGVMMHPQQGMMHPQQGMMHPNQMAQHHGQAAGMGQHPNAMSQGMGHPQGVPQHPNAPQGMGHSQGVAQHPNAPQGMGQHPNVPQGMMQHPNEIPHGMGHPQGHQLNAPQGMGQHPNVPQGMVQHPNAPQGMLQHPNAPQGMGQHPNAPQGMGQQPSALPQNPGVQQNSGSMQGQPQLSQHQGGHQQMGIHQGMDQMMVNQMPHGGQPMMQPGMQAAHHPQMMQYHQEMGAVPAMPSNHQFQSQNAQQPASGGKAPSQQQHSSNSQQQHHQPAQNTVGSDATKQQQHYQPAQNTIGSEPAKQQQAAGKDSGFVLGSMPKQPSPSN